MQVRKDGIVWPVRRDIFDESWPGAQIEEIPLTGQYVSEALTKERLRAFIAEHCESGQLPENGVAMILRAPTGSGKNHFVHHVVRPLAAEQGTNVLYLSNRKALYTQQMREADEAVNPVIKKRFYPRDTPEFQTGSITLMTYHHYYQMLQKYGSGYYQKFKYIAADEIHFAVADSQFNADTGSILASIPRVFSRCVRLYLSATPEDAASAIYEAEWRAMPPDDNVEKTAIYYPYTGEIKNKEKLPKLTMFTMAPDYSSYRDMYVFSKKESLIHEILRDDPDMKWVVFVSRKQDGKDLRSTLEEQGIRATYLDSETRSSGNIHDRHRWETIMETGQLGDARVLIATSVLDNGFSIHDTRVGRVVLTSSNRVEFLQELGRVRLQPSQKLRVYFSRMSKADTHPERRQQILDVFAMFYGSQEIREYPYPDAEIEASPNRVLQLIMAPGAHEDLGFVSSRPIRLLDGSAAREPYINPMARWYAKLLGDQAAEYDRLIDEYGADMASVLYKARWLCEEPEKLTPENFMYVDIDKPGGKQVEAMLDTLCSKYLDTPMLEPKKGLEVPEMRIFETFSRELQKLFTKLCPRNSSLNNGANRGSWKNRAINSHLAQLNIMAGLNTNGYRLEKDSLTGFWKLMRGSAPALDVPITG